MLNDLIPIILFFCLFKIKGIFWATAGLIAAMSAQYGLQYHKNKTLSSKDKFILGSVWILGGATLLLHNQQFIMWKPTLIFTVFALALAINHLKRSQPMIQQLLGENIELPLPVWRNLNLAWCLFFLVMAMVNTYVITYYDVATWVSFKLFGIMGLCLIFSLAQAIYITRAVKQIP